MPVDYSKYPPDWEARRERVLNRAEHQCEFCGIPNGETVYSVPFLVTGSRGLKQRMIWFRDPDDALRAVDCQDQEVKALEVVLTVAHLDHNESDWEVEDERLAALCQMCHLRYDSNERQKRRKAE